MSVPFAVVCTVLAIFLWAVAFAVKKYGGNRKFKKPKRQKNYGRKWKKIKAVADAYLEEF